MKYLKIENIKMPTMETGFVFTNYNSSNYTKDLIATLNASERLVNCPIVIVDNDSDEENVNLLKQLQENNENVHVIFNNINLGYFKGLNAGINFLRANFQEINCMVVGNNDLIFPIDFIDALYHKIELFQKYPVISPNIVTDNGFHQNPHVISRISSTREIIFDVYYSNYLFAKLIRYLSRITSSFTDRKDEMEHEKAQLIHQGHGSCYILGPLFLSNFKELFAPTFLMGEEFFLSIQLKSKNFQVYYEPTINITHQCHSSIDKIPSKKMWKFAKEAHHQYRKYQKDNNLNIS